jgi:hypothetical protein
VARCPTSLAVAEMMGLGHEPAAIWWPASTSPVTPDALRRHDLVGLVNVRMFRIEGDPGALVMDTLGLHVLDLPDLRCHFTGLDPDDVARILHTTAAYVDEHGDVIDDGHTISGIGDDAWRCQHEDALVPPHRLVLDLDPATPKPPAPATARERERRALLVGEPWRGRRPGRPGRGAARSRAGPRRR